tara:strand:- start:129 stop:551 length:423 start_codon:yes stop_codon:yes gene_type:complete
MLHTKAMTKTTKRLGISPFIDGRKAWGVYAGYAYSWYIQEGEIQALHVRRSTDMPDSMTDYFPGFYPDNITQLLNYICPPPPKYKVGSLVEGRAKQAKRRKNLAGRQGLVLSHLSYGGYMILWADKSQSDAPEKSLQLIN